MYFYKSHIGDGYFTDKKLEDKELICSVCGGVDELVGECDNESLFDIINNAGVRYSKLMADEIMETFGCTLQNNQGYAFCSKQ